MNNQSKQLEDKWLNKWDAEIMWWFYDILENELDIIMIHDSSELRDMLKKARKKIQLDLLNTIGSDVKNVAKKESVGSDDLVFRHKCKPKEQKLEDATNKPCTICEPVTIYSGGNDTNPIIVCKNCGWIKHDDK